MVNGHTCNTEIENLHVDIQERMYLYIVNSCNIFLSEFDEMKRWDGTVMALATAVHFAAWRNCTFRTKGVCKNKSLPHVCNEYPMFTLHTAGLRIYNGKSVSAMSWNIVRGKKTTIPILEYWDTVDFLLERKLINLKKNFHLHWTCPLQPKTFVLPIQWVQ